MNEAETRNRLYEAERLLKATVRDLFRNKGWIDPSVERDIRIFLGDQIVLMAQKDGEKKSPTERT